MLGILNEVHQDMDLTVIDEEFRGPIRDRPDLQSIDEVQEEALKPK